MMILLRVLVLGGVAWLIWMIWRQIKGPATRKAPEQFEAMVQCAQCQQHIPENRAVSVSGQHYCQEHAPKNDA